MRCLALLIFTLILPLSSFAITDTEAIKKLESMAWYTEDFPPYNYKGSDGLATGITVDILLEVFSRLGIAKTRKDFEIVPWARSYHYLKTKPGTALFSMTYTPKRLEIFKFVGPVAEGKVAFIASKKKNLSISSPKDLESLSLGSIREDIGEQLAKKFGIKDNDFVKLSQPSLMINRLSTGKLDVIAYNEGVAKYLLKKINANPDEYESVYVLNSLQMGYAFHLSTDSNVLKPLRKVLAQVVADGTAQKITSKYLGGQSKR